MPTYSSADEVGRDGIRIVQGDLLASDKQTLVNTVNTVGVMGKGVALAFKKRFPAMYDDYVARCKRGEVKLGRPYIFAEGNRLIVNFPTKGHWRSVSRLDDIVAGLEFLEQHYTGWGIESLAIPPLGCGNGQLEWDVVKRTLYRHLARLDVPVDMYAPFGADGDQLHLPIDSEVSASAHAARLVEPSWVALVAILALLNRRPYRWPVGRIMFQKIAYFAAQTGIPLKLQWERNSFGPYAPGLKAITARLQNNGLVTEHQRGAMFEVLPGLSYRDAVTEFGDQLELWKEQIHRTVEFMASMDTHRAEVAATAHYAATHLELDLDRPPSVTEVVEAVEQWKVGRKPGWERDEVVMSVMSLATARWIRVTPDELARQFEAAYAGV